MKDQYNDKGRPAMSTGRHRFNLAFLVASVVLTVLCMSLLFLYQTVYEQDRNNLINIVSSQANLARAVQRFDAEQSGDAHPQGAAWATIGQLIDAQNAYKGFAETDELLLVARTDEGVGYLNSQRFGVRQQTLIPLPENQELALPARALLAGGHGVISGNDYRNEPVLAAYEWIDELNIGLIAKIDVAEIREPFVRQAMELGLVALLLSVLTAIYLRKVEQDYLGRIRKKSEQLGLILGASAEGIFGVDMQGNCIFANPACASLCGYDDESQLVGLDISYLLRHHDSSSSATFYRERTDASEAWFYRQDGSSFAVEYSVRPLFEGDNLVGSVVSFSDISDRLEAEKGMRYLASHDAATGLLNRIELERRLGNVLQKRAPAVNHALLFLDLDRFKSVNDNAGHAAGDLLLKELSHMMSACLRSRDTLARIGGDEFAIVLENCPVDVANRIAQSIVDVTDNYRLQWNEMEFSVGISIGLQMLESGSSIEDQMMKADAACYQAKNHGRGQVWIADQSDRKTA
jgi:diguanylate cyclase (GGDEF)-like protein/PAS domain S-box-containing protein